MTLKSLLSRNKDSVRAESKTILDGRKYRLALTFAGVMILGLLLSTTIPAVETLYGEFVTSLVALYLAYCGGNVSNKWVLGKYGKVEESGTPVRKESKKDDPEPGAP